MVPLRRLWSSSYPPNAFGLYDMYLRASQRPPIFMPTVMTVWVAIWTDDQDFHTTQPQRDANATIGGLILGSNPSSPAYFSPLDG